MGKHQSRNLVAAWSKEQETQKMFHYPNKNDFPKKEYLNIPMSAVEPLSDSKHTHLRSIIDRHPFLLP